jgi:serine/threonine protein kinase
MKIVFRNVSTCTIPFSEEKWENESAHLHVQSTVRNTAGWIDQLFPMSLESAMISYGLPEPEVTSTAAFISVCLRLDPEERPSASDISDHPWLEMAYVLLVHAHWEVGQ